MSTGRRSVTSNDHDPMIASSDLEKSISSQEKSSSNGAVEGDVGGEEEGTEVKVRAVYLTCCYSTNAHISFDSFYLTLKLAFSRKKNLNPS